MPLIKISNPDGGPLSMEVRRALASAIEKDIAHHEGILAASQVYDYSDMHGMSDHIEAATRKVVDRYLEARDEALEQMRGEEE